MDIDAEMAKLQEEARRELAARRPAAPAPAAEADPTLDPTLADGDAPSAERSGLPPVAWPDALQQASRLRGGLDALEGKAAQARRLPLQTKIVLAVVGVIGALAAWHFVLAPLLSILLTLGVVFLIGYGLVQLFGPDDDDDSDAL